MPNVCTNVKCHVEMPTTQKCLEDSLYLVLEQCCEPLSWQSMEEYTKYFM